MGRPQQPELNRSGTTALTPDSFASEREADPPHREDEPRGPVPPENRPGHHPEEEQDKPDPGAFAAKAAGEGRPAEEGRSRRSRVARARWAWTGGAAVAGGVTVAGFLRRRWR